MPKHELVACGLIWLGYGWSLLHVAFAWSLENIWGRLASKEELVLHGVGDHTGCSQQLGTLKIVSQLRIETAQAYNCRAVSFCLLGLAHSCNTAIAQVTEPTSRFVTHF